MFDFDILMYFAITILIFTVVLYIGFSFGKISDDITQKENSATSKGNFKRQM